MNTYWIIVGAAKPSQVIKRQLHSLTLVKAMSLSGETRGKKTTALWQLEQKEGISEWLRERENEVTSDWLGEILQGMMAYVFFT